MASIMDVQTILVVEDNATLRRYIGNSLEKAGYHVVLADSGKSAFSRFRHENLDLVLLDLKLGDMDGLEILKTIRRQNETLPVIIVSTCVDLKVKVGGFEIGCDDYITKPFYSEELISRVKRQLKRRGGVREKASQTIAEDIERGPFRLDLRACRVYKNGESIEMRKKLFEILLFFARNTDQILSKESILANCWDDCSVVSDNTLYVHIRQLRSLIEDTPETPAYIQTIRGVGFTFSPKERGEMAV